MKKVVLNYLMITVLIVATVFTSCKHDDEEPAGEFYRMNIDEAKTLVFTLKETGGNKLYGIKKSSLVGDVLGEAYEISCFDINGKKIMNDDYYINAFDAGDNIIVFFDPYIPSSTGSSVQFGIKAYLVKKINGLIKEIPNEYLPNYYQHYIFRACKSVQFDKYRNFYYIIDGDLCQVSSSGSSEFRFSHLFLKEDIVYGFCTDDEGQILYSNTIMNNKLKLRKLDDTIVSLEPDFEVAWKGTDGVLYGITVETEQVDDWVYQYRYLVKIQNGEVIKIREVDFYIGDVFYVQDKIIANSYRYDGFYSSCLVDISNETAYKEISCSISANMVINNQLCILHHYSFYCESIDLDTGATSPLFTLSQLALNGYYMDKIFSVTETGVVFSGLDRDSKPVFAIVGNNDIITPHPIIQGQVSLVLLLN
jgi:hypothetical protein